MSPTETEMKQARSEAEFLDELTNQKVVTTKTLGTSPERNINLAINRAPSILNKFLIPSVGRKRGTKLAKGQESIEKMQTILGESGGADNRVEMEKENIVRIFMKSLCDYNKHLELMYHKLGYRIPCIILFGSRMDESQKPRPKSDVDYIVLTHRAIQNINLPNMFDNYLKKTCHFLSHALSMNEITIESLKERCAGKTTINQSGIFDFLDKQNTVIITDTEDEELKKFLNDLIPDEYQFYNNR